MVEILHLNNHQIDKDKWDKLIKDSPEGQPYALSWYLDVVSPNWNAFVLIDESGNYAYALPLPVNKQYGILYLKQPFFCQQLGLFSNSEVMEPEILKEFIKKIKTTFSYSIDYSFNSGNVVNWRDDNICFTSTRYLNLSMDYVEIFKNYKKDRKVNLKRAMRFNSNVVEGEEIKPLIALFQEFTAYKIYGGVSQLTYDMLVSLFDILKRNGNCILYYCLDEDGKILAGSLFVIWRNRIIYLFSSSSDEGKKKNGMTLILDNLIRSYSGKNFILDFESPSSGETDIEGGIALFSSSFGSVKKYIPQIKYNNLPRTIKVMKAIRMKLHGGLKFFKN